MVLITSSSWRTALHTISSELVDQLKTIRKTSLEPKDILKVTKNFRLTYEGLYVEATIDKAIEEDQYLQSFDGGYDVAPSDRFRKKAALDESTDAIEVQMAIQSRINQSVGIFILQYGQGKRLTNDFRSIRIKEGQNKISFTTTRHNKASFYRFRLKFGDQPCQLRMTNIEIIQKTVADFTMTESARIDSVKRYSNFLAFHDDDEPLIFMVKRNEVVSTYLPPIDLGEAEYAVSIIVPVYKTEEYLPKCLDSLLNQTLKNIEIVAVNDGSPDNSLAILNEYSNKYNNIKIVNQENKGLGAARNSGMKVAKGKYLMFLDSDDWYDENACLKAVAYAENYRCDMVIGRIAWYDDGKIAPQENIERKLGKYSERRFANLRNETGAVFVNVVCTLYSRKLILDNEIMFPEGVYWEDMPFALQAWYHSGQIGYIGDIIYYRLKREGSITQTFNMKGFLDKITIAKLINLYFDKYKIHNMYNYFEWTIDDIQNRVDAIDDPEVRFKAEDIWAKEKPILQSFQKYHEELYLSRKK